MNESLAAAMRVEIANLRSDNERLSQKLEHQKRFLNMVIHEMKHPIEALQFLHGKHKQDLESLQKSMKSAMVHLDMLRTQTETDER